MQEIGPDIFTFDRPLSFLGIEVGTRMTVLRLGGKLLLHSPIDVAPETLQSLGEPSWVLAPNKYHHLFVGPWAESGVEAWAAPGLPEKRRDVTFKGVISSGTHPFGDEVEVMALSCFSMTNEVVVYHKPSRTLIVTDLVFHFPQSAPFATKAAMWCACAYPGCKASVLERVGMKRDLARKEIGAILDYDFDRLVMAHGEIIQSGARDVFAGAYKWLGI